MYQIIYERPQDAAQIEPLLDMCFGPARFEKTAYKIREGLQPVPELSLAAIDGDTLLGTIRYWPITIGGTFNALLLGPIAVMPSKQGEGIGVALIRESLKLAEKLPYQAVVLVGDPEYYARFGFSSADEKGISFPGPVETRRFLVHELTPGSLSGVSGVVKGTSLAETPNANLASAEDSSTEMNELLAFAPPRQA